jgi:peptidoglycan biosynthesis protein MviN/MurJ (putative lipid II flippase)
VGAGRVRAVAKALLCASVLNLSCSFLLIRPYGLAGIAVSTVIASVVIDLLVIPLMLQRIVDLSVKGFLVGACVRPAIVGMLQVLLMVAIRLLGRPQDWHHLIMQGGLAGMGIAATVVAVGLTQAEREKFIMRPLQRLLGLPGSRPEKVSR